MSRFLFRLIFLLVMASAARGLQAQTSGLPIPPGLDAANAPAVQEASLLSGQPADEGGATTSASRMRDPFWPVGYTPKVVRRMPVDIKGAGIPALSPAGPEPSHLPQWDEARRKLDIRGISLIGRDKETGKPRYLAMVAGKLVEEGDVVSVTYEERVYRWKVVGIGTPGVTFQKMDVK